MLRNLRRWWMATGLVVASIGAAVPALAADSPPPIQPNQYFSALVQGQSGRARIFVNCEAGVGHPVAGQTVEVVPVTGTPRTTDGFTGTARVIDVFATRAAALPVVELSTYQTPTEIPTWTIVPCSGTDVMTFVGFAGGVKARPATVVVTFDPHPF